MTSLTLDRAAFLSLVESARPLSDVRELLLSWADAGASREEIRSLLNDVRSELQAAGREAEEDRVLEALDLVEGWVSPHLKLVSAQVQGPGPQITVNMDTIDLRKAERTTVKGRHVNNLQGLLKATRKPDQDPGPIDGLGGQKTKAAVLAFQGANSLDKDAIVGPKTWGKLIPFGS